MVEPPCSSVCRMARPRALTCAISLAARSFVAPQAERVTLTGISRCTCAGSRREGCLWTCSSAAATTWSRSTRPVPPWSGVRSPAGPSSSFRPVPSSRRHGVHWRESRAGWRHLRSHPPRISRRAAPYEPAWESRCATHCCTGSEDCRESMGQGRLSVCLQHRFVPNPIAT